MKNVFFFDCLARNVTLEVFCYDREYLPKGRSVFSDSGETAAIYGIVWLNRLVKSLVAKAF
jgi:hypothetical protein